jgi:hypothetical protein
MLDDEDDRYQFIHRQAYSESMDETDWLEINADLPVISWF